VRAAAGLVVLAVMPSITSAQQRLDARQRGASTDVLRRRAHWGAAIAPAGGDSGALVRRIDAATPAARAGLRVGDRVVSLNGRSVLGADAFWPAFRTVRGRDTVRAVVVRPLDGASPDTVTIRFVVDSLPHERIAGTSVTYGAIRSDRGYVVRTVVTRPIAAGNAPLPGMLFIPWLSCDPVEKPDPGTDGFAHTLREVASRSGLVFMRVEKPGLGDSEGPDCRHGSLDDEMAAYRAALRALRAMPGVDSTRLYLWGGSLGGALAPILAAEDGAGIAGVIAAGGFTKTWYEHMLEIERRRLQLLGSSPSEVNEAMRGFALFYAEYLIRRRTPEQVLADHGELRPLWYDEPAHQYGRPASYYHAVQQLDVEGAWSTIAQRRIPALVVWGEYDWIMSRDDQERAVRIMDAQFPGGATLAVVPKTDHGLMVYSSLADAFGDGRPTYDGAAARAILAWLRRR
jgi:pimeloyl-ACP methyl ester carboxylesterase